MTRRYIGWRAVLWFVASYHLLLGSILLFSGELAIRLLRSLAGATIEGSAQMGIAGEILACYLLAFGLMMALGAWNPVKNRGVISIGVALIALRVFQRLYFAEKVMTVFQVPPGKYWSATAIVLLLGAILAAFRWRLYGDMHGAGAAATPRS